MMKINLDAIHRMTIRYLLENWNDQSEEQQKDILNALNAHACHLLENWNDLSEKQQEYILNVLNAHACPPEPDMTPNPTCVRGFPKDLCIGCEQCAILH